MAITVKKQVTLKDHVKEAQQEKDLFWLSSLRQFVPPIGSKSRWHNLSPEACKLLILIWGLDSAQWTPKKNMAYKGVHYFGLEKLSGYDNPTFSYAVKQLRTRKLIKVDWEIVDNAPEIWVRLIYNLPPDVIENGV
jgi:hypothetical protein